MDEFGFSQDSKDINNIKKKLESSHLSRFIFKQTCLDHDSLLLSQIFLKSSPEIIQSIMTDECVAKTSQSNELIIYKLSKALAPKHFHSLIINQSIFFEKMTIEFRENPLLFSNSVTEEMCNKSISDSSIPNRWKQLITCLYAHPTNLSFVNSFKTFGVTTPPREFVHYIRQVSLSFLDISLKSIENNQLNDAFNIFQSWKAFVEIIIDKNWQSSIKDQILYYLYPPFSLVSTILSPIPSKDYQNNQKGGDLLLISKFHESTNNDSREKCIKILRELIEAFPKKNKNYHEKIELLQDMPHFMNPKISASNHKDLMSIPFNVMGLDFWTRLFISIFKFNPNGFEQFFHEILNNQNFKNHLPKLAEALFKHFPHILDYPIKGNLLFYYLDLSDMETHIGHSMILIEKFIRQLDSSCSLCNLFVLLELIIANYPQEMGNDFIKEIKKFTIISIPNEDFEIYFRINQFFKSIKNGSKFNWLLSLENEINVEIDEKATKMPSFLRNFIKERVIQLEFLARKINGNEAYLEQEKFKDLYLMLPKGLSNLTFSSWLMNSLPRFVLDQKRNSISKSIPLSLSLISLKRDNVKNSIFESFLLKHPISYVHSEQIEKNLEIIKQFKGEIIFIMNAFRMEIEKGNGLSHLFQFKNLELSDEGPRREYFHAITRLPFLHLDIFNIFTEEGLPSSMVHPRMSKVIGAMIGYLMTNLNIIPSIPFNDIVYGRIHDLSEENLELFWQVHCQADPIMKGLINLINGNDEIKNVIFNLALEKLTLTDFEEPKGKIEFPLSSLIHSNWKEMYNEPEEENENEPLVTRFNSEGEARQYLRKILNIFKFNLFDNLKAFRDGLSIYLNVKLLKSRNISLASLLKGAGNIPSPEEIIKRLVVDKSADKIFLDSTDENGNPIRMSLKEAFCDFLREMKPDHYKALLSRWFVSPHVSNLDSLNPEISVYHKGCIDKRTIDDLKDLGYSFKNTIDQLPILCPKNVYPCTHTCHSTLEFVHYKTVDEMRIGLLVLSNSDLYHSKQD